MRVAIHFPPDHPTSPGAVAAYHLGRVEDGVHNKLWHTGQTIPFDEFLRELIDTAKEEFPECEVVVERLVSDGDEGHWVPKEADGQAAVAGTPQPEQVVGVEQATESGGEVA